jgi:hypothetical protein
MEKKVIVIAGLDKLFSALALGVLCFIVREVYRDVKKEEKRRW